MRVALFFSGFVVSVFLVACGDDSKSRPTSGGAMIATYEGKTFESLKSQVEQYPAAVKALKKLAKEMHEKAGGTTDPYIKSSFLQKQKELLADAAKYERWIERAKHYLAKGCTTEQGAQMLEKREREAKERIAEEERQAGFARERAERERVKEEKEQAKADAKDKRRLEEEAVVRAAREDAKAEFVGQYRANLTLHGPFVPTAYGVKQDDVAYLLLARQDGSVILELRVKGRVEGQASGTWKLGESLNGTVTLDLSAKPDKQGLPPSGTVILRVRPGDRNGSVVGPLFGPGKYDAMFLPVTEGEFATLRGGASSGK